MPRETLWNLLWIVIVALLPNRVQLGPARILREIYPEIESEANQQVCVVGDVVYAANDIIPAEQSCLRCKCQPPKVDCETIVCAKNSGCKAVHSPNKCCPEYQCECEHEGKIYANGEKIPSSGEDCKVCYCRGGEIKCTDVTCYLRTDCEAKQVPGQCCPKYDNCPENIPERILPTQESSTEILQLWPVSNLVLNVSQMDQKITIREIMPEIKEIPMTVPSNIDYSNFNDLLVTDPEPEASEVLEIFQPPPVLRIGDKLLFLHEGNFVSENETTSPSSIITIIGAEGLEQGFEESAEESLNQPLFNNSNDLELKTSESTHILSLVKNKKKPEVTTTSVPEETTLVSTITNTNFPEDNETTTLEATTLTEIAQTETTPFFTENITTTMEENSTFTDIPSKESLEATSDSGETVQNTSNDFTENASIESSENPEVADMVQSTHSFDDAELLRDLTQKNSTLKNDVEMIDINKTYTKLPQKIIEKRANSAEAPGDDIFEQLRDEIYDDNTERILSAKEDKEESERIFRELLDETSTPKTVRKGDKNAEMIKKITDAIAKLTLRNKGGPLDFNLVGLVSGFFGPPRKKK